VEQCILTSCTLRILCDVWSFCQALVLALALVEMIGDVQGGDAKSATTAAGVQYARAWSGRRVFKVCSHYRRCWLGAGTSRAKGTTV
jgi:hypothetical protein